jgi:hypothetical protein
MTLFEQALADIDALELRRNTTITEFRITDPTFAAWLSDANRLVGEWYRTMGRGAAMALVMHCMQVKKLRFLLTHMSNVVTLSRGGEFIGDWGVVLTSQQLYEHYFPEAKAERMAKVTLTYSKLVSLVERFYRDNPTPERVIERIKQTHPGQPFNERTVRALVERSIVSLKREVNFLKKS